MNPMNLDSAIEAARKALHDWSARTMQHRQLIAERFAQRLLDRKSEMTEIISSETGKPRWESATEVDAMLGKVPISIRAIGQRRQPSEQTSSDITSTTRYKPFGVVAVLGPFNFPGHLPNGHIVPALLAGNTIVFKPSEQTPRTGGKMVELWHEAGLPPGAINLVQGDASMGRALVAHCGIDGVFFTGSFNAGREINRALADHPGKIVALEMGGNNPLVVHEVADLRAAAHATILSAYLTAGQRCSCARRLILVEGAECAAFVEQLLQLMSRIRVGLYTDSPEPFMGPVIDVHAAQKLLAAQDDLIARGGHSLAHMQPQRGIATVLSPGLIDVTDVKNRADEELFGPILQLIRVKDFDAAIIEANNTRFGLSAGLLSDNRSMWEKFCRDVHAGVINWNRPLTGASSSLPFGGVGDSGNNRPSAYFACDYCSYPVASIQSDHLAMPLKLLPGIEA